MEKILLKTKEIIYNKKGIKETEIIVSNGVPRNTRTLTYDKNGNKIYCKDLIMGDTAFEYDKNNRLIREEGESSEVIYHYENNGLSRYYTFIEDRCEEKLNDKGQVVNRIDKYGETWYEYDNKGNLTYCITIGTYPSLTSQLPLDLNIEFKYENEYDDKGNLISIKSNNGGILFFEYTYNEQGKIVKVEMYSTSLNNSYIMQSII